jgi:hypothetical protein
MYTRNWHVIKDDQKRTFEVVEQASNDNAFSNKTHAMQKAGMTVSGVVLPVTNKNSSKNTVTIQGYSREEGLYQRLLEQHQAIILKDSGFWEE